VNKSIGLFREFEIWWCISENTGRGASACDWLLVEDMLPPASATRRRTCRLCSCLANCAGVSNLLVSGYNAFRALWASSHYPNLTSGTQQEGTTYILFE
jgi:hypothetical protein